MSTFTSPLDLRYRDGCTWELLQAFEYKVGALSSCETVSVPAGFITDFASVPRFFWRILPPTGEYGKAAVIHDWLYRKHETWRVDGVIRRVHCSRERADQIFLEAMVVLNVPRWKRQAMYRAVRWFGCKPYAKGRIHG